MKEQFKTLNKEVQEFVAKALLKQNANIMLSREEKFNWKTFQNEVWYIVNIYEIETVETCS